MSQSSRGSSSWSGGAGFGCVLEACAACFPGGPVVRASRAEIEQDPQREAPAGDTGSWSLTVSRRGWTLVLGKWSVRNPNADAPRARHLAPDVQAPVLLGRRQVWDEGSAHSASSCSLNKQE